MKTKHFGILIILIVVTSCNFIDCNYEKLTDKEYQKIAGLNRNAKLIDTMYNDKCLKGFFHVYLKTESSDLETDNEVEEIMNVLKTEKMDRDIWVFNNQKVFLYRMFYINSISKSKLTKTDLQYPNE